MRLAIILAVLAVVSIGSAILFQWLEEGRSAQMPDLRNPPPSLVICSACKAQISPRAETCPKCGDPR